jgi:cell division protein FtsZ
MLEIVDTPQAAARIKVFGAGGGGSNAVNRMIQAGLCGVEFWVANTDLQALEQSICPNRLQIGRAVTRGLGAGGDPEIGRLSATEDRETLSELLRGTDMLFITAGMGGGTGTGAAPVVAEIARELGILTVAIVTKPFQFEGKKKMARALAGLEELRVYVDTLISIPNQKLLNIVQPGTPFREAMLVADEVLFQATRGISDLITGHGDINLDFADVKTVMRNRGNALLGCGVATGKNRAVEAAQAAVSSPLLEEVNIFGAEALLINVQGGSGMSLHEAADAAQFISERVGEETDVFWGSVVDPTLGEEMRVTLIATGFPRTETRSEAVEGAGVSGAVATGLLPVRRAEPAAERAEVSERVLTPSAPAEVERVPVPVAARECLPEPLATGISAWEVPGERASESWNLGSEAEREIFLPLEAPDLSAMLERPAEKSRTSTAPEPESSRWKSRVSAGAREESHLDPRPLRRHPLDKPAFMRKRMMD